MPSDTKILVVAEVGVNHGGSLERACALVDAAASCGADVVKFQTFRSERLVHGDTETASYQRKATGFARQKDLLRELELSQTAFIRLAAHCKLRGVLFASTPFDLESLEFLVDEIDVPAIKISSGDLTYGPLLLRAARTRRQIWLSTGMSFLSEVENALRVLAFGMLFSHGNPKEADLARAYATPQAQALLRERVILLHCCSMYPAPENRMNLRAIQTLAQAFGVRVGISDHTTSTSIAAVAVGLGAILVEKHFTLDRAARGPDHLASLDPELFSEMVRRIRETESALGDGRKVPQIEEWELRRVARRGVYERGGKVEFLRPENGQSPIDSFARNP